MNIFYQPDYTKRKKELFTLKLRDSVLLNKFINICYFFNFPIPNRLITNGPHKAMNNLVRTFKNKEYIAFNKLTYDFSYIIQFDWFGEKVLNEIIKNPNPNKRVLIGPLYTDLQLKKLAEYTKNFKFIKIVAASESASKRIIEILKKQININNIVVLPTGIIPEDKLEKRPYKKRNERCLIYFKNRKISDLNKVKNFLDKKGIKYDIFEYGKYKNQKLLRTAQTNKFCILINSSESQGIAVQELFACNIPMFVWDSPNENNNINMSSVPYFDNQCGVKVHSFEEFLEKFDKFENNIIKYNPKKIVLEKLTFEKFIKNLIFYFKNF